MQAVSPHLLLLGCPHRGLDALAQKLGEQPGWTVLGDLRLTMTATAGELQSVFARSQEQLPPDLLRALDLHFPDTAATDPALRVRSLLAQRQNTETPALIRELIERALPARSVLVETEGCLRLQVLERWLEVSADADIDLRFVHIVEPAAEFATSAAAALKDRLFIPPDYRSHTGPYPQFAPQLAWYRMHRNIEILFESLPAACKLRVARSTLDGALREGGVPVLLRHLLLPEGVSAPSAAAAPLESPAEIAAMEQRYGLWG